MTAMGSKRGTYASLNEALTTQAATTINAIKDYILQTHLKPGDPLPTEAQLCADLGVSRSSVREAVRTLVALDIVQVRHGHGMFVGQVSMRPMIESLVQVRSSDGRGVRGDLDAFGPRGGDGPNSQPARPRGIPW